MKEHLRNIKHFRRFLLQQMDELTAEQLNFIPQGYANNIIWNVIHLIATTQALCYKRAGLSLTIDESYVTPFLPGTKPERLVSSEEIGVIKELMIKSIDDLETDTERKIFEKYTLSERIKEVYNIKVSNIEEAIEFLLYHEGYHTGYIIAMIHLVKAN